MPRDPRLRTFRPLARLRQGQVDWYRIENHAGTDTARVLIYDEIGYWGVSASDFVRELEAVDAQHIDLHVNSPGGEVFDGVAIHNAIKNHPAHVVATVDGLAASAASFIVMAADEVVMEPNATMMIHDGIGFVLGNAADMREQADLLDKVSGTIAGMYAAKSGRPADDFRALMLAETWFNADEAVAAGLADRVAGQEDDPETQDSTADHSGPAARWDLSIFNFAGRDQAPAPVLPPATATPVATATPDPTAQALDLAAVIRKAIKEGVR